jgi:Tat protein translocase TatB subunit
MFGTLGGPEVILILVVALIVFGPRRLPEIGKSMGKMLAEFRKASNDFKRTIDDELEAERVREAQSQLPAAPPVDTPHEVAPPESAPVVSTTAESAAAVVPAPEPWRPSYAPPPWTSDAPAPSPGAEPSPPATEGSGTGADNAPAEPRPAAPVEAVVSRNRSTDE